MNHVQHTISRNNMEAFVIAINHSRIRSLSLAFSSTLHNLFLSSFRCYYPPSRYLRNISLSGTNYTLDELSVPCAALRLLTLSRVLMLYTSRPQSLPMPNSYKFPQITPPCSAQHEERHASELTCMSVSGKLSCQDPNSNSPKSVSPLWRSLPVELQLQLIQYMVPLLSFGQIIRIVNYASDINTLPRDDNMEMIYVEHWLEVVGCGSG